MLSCDSKRGWDGNKSGRGLKLQEGGARACHEGARGGPAQCIEAQRIGAARSNAQRGNPRKRQHDHPHTLREQRCWVGASRPISTADSYRADARNLRQPLNSEPARPTGEAEGATPAPHPLPNGRNAPICVQFRSRICSVLCSDGRSMTKVWAVSTKPFVGLDRVWAGFRHRA